MHFLSVEWLGWLFGVVSVYWILPKAWRDVFLGVITLGFLALYSPISAVSLTGLTVAVYFLCNANPLAGWRAMAAGGLVIAILLGFKAMLPSMDMEPGVVRDFVMPLGMAYYAIRFLSYIIDRYKGTLETHRLKDFFLYQFFLPTIVVGPIHRFPAFFNDLKYKRWDASNISLGLQRILYGYAKIVILGNYLIEGVLASHVAALHETNAALATYLDVVIRGLNLYFQFSGFSDVAIGFALLLGYRVMENFNWPYLAKNISEFWRNWHISLTSFAREHVFSLVFAMSRNQYAAIFGTMVFIGVWHELSWRYLVWGAVHGVATMIWAAVNNFQDRRGIAIRNPVLRPFRDAFCILLTVHFVWLSFVIVREPTFPDVLDVYGTIFVYWWL